MEHNNPEAAKKLDSPDLQQPHSNTQRGRKFLRIFFYFSLGIILFVSIGCGIYFYLQNFKLKQQTQNFQKDKIIISPESTATPSVSLDEKTSKLSLTDDKCSVEVNYPQLTRNNETTYIWSIDVSDSTTFISYKDREQPSGGLDHSIIVFAKPQGNNSPYYSASIEIICAPNKEGLGFDSFVNKYIEQADIEQAELRYKISKLSETIIGGKKFIPVRFDERDVVVYLGIHKDKLLLLGNSNKSIGVLQEVAEDILKDIRLVD